eukprot:SAG22_NODE_2771_length_2226_cov_1.772920_2_plen_85_part_00
MGSSMLDINDDGGGADSVWLQHPTANHSVLFAIQDSAREFGCRQAPALQAASDLLYFLVFLSPASLPALPAASKCIERLPNGCN